MPLTPAEVHNVAFKKPSIGKRGYDEEEVDAFLDIVEVELSRLLEDNQDLRARLSSGQPLPAEDVPAPDTSALDEAQAELAAARDDNGRLHNQIAELQHALSGSSDSAQQQIVQLQQQLADTAQQLAESRRALEAAQRAAPAPSPSPSGAPAPADHAQQAVQILAMAQQTADQHLGQSKAEADRLLAEARATAETAVSEATAQAGSTIAAANKQAEETVSNANARATRTLADADQRATAQLSEAEARVKQLDDESSSRARKTIAAAEQHRASLQGGIEELRVFEREYRSRLKAYLESQLQDLLAADRAEPDHTPATTPKAAAPTASS